MGKEPEAVNNLNAKTPKFNNPGSRIANSEEVSATNKSLEDNINTHSSKDFKLDNNHDIKIKKENEKNISGGKEAGKKPLAVGTLPQIRKKSRSSKDIKRGNR